MKVLYVATAYEPAWRHGGPPRSAATLCRALVAAGASVTVYCTDNDVEKRLPVPTDRPVSLGGVEVHYLRAYGGPRVCYAPRLLPRLLDAVADFDLVHVDSFWQYPGMAAALACRRRGVPYVISPRGSLIRDAVRQGSAWKRAHLRSVGRQMVAGATATHLTSSLEREQSAPYIAGCRSFVVANPVDLSDLVPGESRQETRSRLGLPDEAFALIYSGRLHPRKALPVLLHAVARLRDRLPHLHLLLAGPDGGSGELLRALAAHLGVAGSVHFLGELPRPRLAAALQAADALALIPYAGENFGNACVEGMGMGLPVVVSENVGIHAEIAADGAGLVTPLDPSEVAEAVFSLAADPARRQRMGEAARRSARTRYAPASVAAAMLERYGEVAA